MSVMGMLTTTIIYNLSQRSAHVLAELKNRLFFWRRKKSRLENLPSDQLRHIIAESDHISAAVDSTQGLLKPEDMARLTELTRMLEKINKESK